MRRLGLTLAVALTVTMMPAAPAGATFPGRSGRIAFTKASEQIAVAKPNGTQIRTLTHFSGFAEAPEYSADGEWIVFDGLNGVNVDLYKMRSDGTGLTQLTDDLAYQWAPSWSPDGKKIVYSADGANSAIWVMKANGSNPHMLCSGPGEYARYSPNGKRIVYGNHADRDIHVMNADGSNDHAITSSPATEGFPDWSPDGKHVAFMSALSGSTQAWIMDADGSNPVQVTTTGIDYGPVFSPDGAKIAAWDGVDEIFVVNVDGSGYHVVYAGSSFGSVGWQPAPTP